MRDARFESTLARLYDVRGDRIITGTFWDGDSCTMIFKIKEDKYTEISSDENFEAFTEDVFIENAEDYKEYVKKINNRYGTEWDEDKRRLYIRFRRNDMSISEAVMRLHGAMMLIAALDWYLYA